MKAIAAVSPNWGIGYQNQLLFHLPQDVKHFKEITLNKTVLMGRKTFESIGKPLPKRQNIILTTQQIEIPNATVIHSLSELKDKSDVICIGGGYVYHQCLDFCTEIYITKIFKDKPYDIFFPNLDNLPNWQITEQSPVYQEQDIHYQFLTYKNTLQ